MTWVEFPEELQKRNGKEELKRPYGEDEGPSNGNNFTFYIGFSIKINPSILYLEKELLFFRPEQGKYPLKSEGGRMRPPFS